jgi:molybdate transport system ATP-binding protein
VIQLDLEYRTGAFALRVQAGLGGRFAAVFGPSGAGKTTLLECIAGLRPGARGRIALDGAVVLDSAHGVELPPESRGVGYVPQDAALFPHLSVRANLRFARPHGPGRLGFDEVVGVLELESLLDRPPVALSGGERQRVALGRALLAQPRLLLLDEPLAGIEAGLKARIFPCLRRVRDELDVPTLYVTHNLAEVWALCNEALVLRQGQVVGQGEPRALLGRGDAPAELVGGTIENLFDATVEASLPGEGLTRVVTRAGLRLDAPPGAWLPGTPVVVGLLAEDVLIATGPVPGLSARNVLPGRVESVQVVQGTALVRVAAGETLLVKVTAQAARSLALEPGRSVYAVIKTHALHLLAGG